MKRAIKYRNLLCTSVVLFFSVLSCEVQDDWFLDIPVFADGSVLTGTSPLSEQCKYAIEGIYTVIGGADFFGDTIVIKNTGDKISFFGYKYGSYFILDAGIKGAEILFEGYWRHAFNDDTGLARFKLSDAGLINNGDTTVASVSITGVIGNGQINPNIPVELELISRFTSRLRNDPFIIGAHRAGGRTSDKLPVSENSVEMINYTNYFGSNGIELDVRLTKDNVPVLYHDEELNIRLIRKGPLFGKIGDYDYKQLLTMVRLVHGEKIPTLTEAFDAVLANPYIKTIWLDIKDPESISIVIPMQLDYLDKAQKAGKDLQILIGLPADNIYRSFTSYPGYLNIPSLCELSPEKVTAVNAKAWGFRWTEGLREQDVINMHNQGRKCLVWTLDVPQFTEIYATAGGKNPSKRFDGILTNYPTILAYYHYVRHNY